MTRWIGVVFAGTSDSHEDAFIVKADTIDDAAAKVADAARGYWDAHDNDGEAIDNVYLAPWDGRVAFTVGTLVVVDRSELQCCGGGENAAHVGRGGHWGNCPEAPDCEECEHLWETGNPRCVRCGGVAAGPEPEAGWPPQ